MVVQQPPFTADKWVNITITFAGIGSGKGHAQLYLNGKSMGTTPEIPEKLEWDMSKAAIRLGVGYVGLFDELSVYNKELTAAEVRAQAK